MYQETVTTNSSSVLPLSGQSTSLSYINFEEGRVRVMQPISQGTNLDAVVIDGNINLPAGKKGS
ncbi:hypothetical protein ACO1LA_14530, partial [Staphylococcus aureus]